MNKKELFKVYNGKSIEQMVNLRKENRIPASIHDIMKIRLETRNEPEEIRNAYLKHPFKTSDAAIYHPNGKIKIILDCQNLKEMNPRNSLEHGALTITEEAYRNLEGYEFKKSELGKLSVLFSLKEAKEHPVNKILSRDESLLNEYADYLFFQNKKIKGYRGMGIFLSSYSNSTPLIRAWRIQRADFGFHSNLDAFHSLEYQYNHLLGILPVLAKERSYEKATA